MAFETNTSKGQKQSAAAISAAAVAVFLAAWAGYTYYTTVRLLIANLLIGGAEVQLPDYVWPLACVHALQFSQLWVG